MRKFAVALLALASAFGPLSVARAEDTTPPPATTTPTTPPTTPPVYKPMNDCVRCY